MSPIDLIIYYETKKPANAGFFIFFGQ
jgi:hypothetical protein